VERVLEVILGLWSGFWRSFWIFERIPQENGRNRLKTWLKMWVKRLMECSIASMASRKYISGRQLPINFLRKNDEKRGPLGSPTQTIERIPQENGRNCLKTWLKM